MAITASNSKQIYSSKYPSSVPYAISVSFTESSTSVVNNTSTLSLSGSIKSSGGSWDSNYDCYLKLYWYDNKTQKETLVATSSAFQDLAANASKSVSGTITVTHKDDGSLSGYAILKYEPGSTSGGYAPSSASVSTSNTKLTTIARASSATVSGTELGKAVTVTIARASNSFAHKVEWKIGNSAYTTISDVTTSASFTPAIATYASQASNSTSVSCTVRVTTYNGSTQIGSSVTCGCTLSIPSSVVPTCSNITFTRIDNGVPSSWGVYVKGYSKVKATISGTGIYGSTISSYYLKGANLTVDSATLESGVLSSSGTYSFEAAVTDSRGRTSDKKTNSITVYDYYKPSVELTAYRCDSSGNASNTGTYLRVKAVYKYATVNSKNSISGTITCNGVTLSSFTSGTAYTMNTNMSTTSAYTATCTITDGLGNSDTYNVSIPTSSIPFMLRDDETGACFGGYSTKSNALESFFSIHGYDKASISASSINVLTVDRTTVDKVAGIRFTNPNGTLGYIGMNLADGGLKRVTADANTVYTILDSNNYSNYVASKEHYHNRIYNTLSGTDRSVMLGYDSSVERFYWRPDTGDGDMVLGSKGCPWRSLYLHTSGNGIYLSDGSTVTQLSVTELGYLNGVTSDIQTQLNNKISTEYYGAKEGNALDVLWTGSSQTPSFTISSIVDYKYFLIRCGDASSAYATWVFCPYTSYNNASVIRGIGGWETATNNGGEIYFVRGSYSGSTFAIAYACYRRTTTMTTNGSTVQLYVKEIVGVK